MMSILNVCRNNVIIRCKNNNTKRQLIAVMNAPVDSSLQPFNEWER